MYAVTPGRATHHTVYHAHVISLLGPRHLEEPPQQSSRARGQEASPEDLVGNVCALLEQHLSLGQRQTTLRLGSRGGSDERVQSRGGQHLRSGVGDVQGHEWGAVEFVEVEALDFVVVVDADFVSLFLHKAMC